ncbi:MAG TPA: polymer-forming cytoskeletal protein [Vicinamibacterales bacterium]|nr:polymer-forming cytoskeletal protein [Vicinamibacterales bacterium]
MSLFGKTLRITGEVWATGDLTLEGQVRGPITCEGGSVMLTASSIVEGDVIGGDITVFGRAAGQLIATDVVDIREGAVVAGAVIAPRLILNEGAVLNGRVDPKRLDAALGVARFQQKQRNTS